MQELLSTKIGFRFQEIDAATTQIILHVEEYSAQTKILKKYRIKCGKYSISIQELENRLRAMIPALKKYSEIFWAEKIRFDSFMLAQRAGINYISKALGSIEFKAGEKLKLKFGYKFREHKATDYVTYSELIIVAKNPSIEMEYPIMRTTWSGNSLVSDVWEGIQRSASIQKDEEGLWFLDPAASCGIASATAEDLYSTVYHQGILEVNIENANLRKQEVLDYINGEYERIHIPKTPFGVDGFSAFNPCQAPDMESISTASEMSFRYFDTSVGKLYDFGDWIPEYHQTIKHVKMLRRFSFSIEKTKVSFWDRIINRGECDVKDGSQVLSLVKNKVAWMRKHYGEIYFVDLEEKYYPRGVEYRFEMIAVTNKNISGKKRLADGLTVIN